MQPRNGDQADTAYPKWHEEVPRGVYAGDVQKSLNAVNETYVVPGATLQSIESIGMAAVGDGNHYTDAYANPNTQTFEAGKIKVEDIANITNNLARVRRAELSTPDNSGQSAYPEAA